MASSSSSPSAKDAAASEGKKKYYVGIAPVHVIAVNPGKELLEVVFDTKLENTPDYLSKREINGEIIPNVRIDFIVKTNPEKSEGIELTSKVSFFLLQKYCTTKDGKKVKVIDKYGRTAWVTHEEFSSHSIPMYKNGPAHIDKDYRGCYPGEEEVTSFFKTLLGIPSVVEKNSSGAWITDDDSYDSSACECRFANIDKLFSGDYSEIEQVVLFSQFCSIKVMFGVRKDDDGKIHQTTYTHKFLRANSNDYRKLADDLAERKSRGAYKNTEFIADTIHELK